jgi:hypothetical protein
MWLQVQSMSGVLSVSLKPNCGGKLRHAQSKISHKKRSTLGTVEYLKSIFEEVT